MGFTCAGLAAEAYDRLTAKNYDLVILDINLPDGTGFDICKRVRKKTSAAVIFLTGNGWE